MLEDFNYDYILFLGVNVRLVDLGFEFIIRFNFVYYGFGLKWNLKNYIYR